MNTRCDIAYGPTTIQKTVECDRNVYDALASHLDSYCAWLFRMNLHAPQTNIAYQDGILTFSQEHIRADGTVPFKDIIERLRCADYSTFGFDSNPPNFIQSGAKTYFIDFYPFLVDQKEVLEPQFEYPYELIHTRYFTPTNTIVTLMNRLPKVEGHHFLDTMKHYRGFLLNTFETILAREKLQLLYILEKHTHQDFLKNYKQYYAASKRITTIPPSSVARLYASLRAL